MLGKKRVISTTYAKKYLHKASQGLFAGHDRALTLCSWTSHPLSHSHGPFAVDRLCLAYYTPAIPSKIQITVANQRWGALWATAAEVWQPVAEASVVRSTHDSRRDHV